MNFFKSQDIARKNTRYLVVLFLLAIVSLVVLTNLLVILVFNHLNVNVASTEILNSRFDWNTIFIVSAGVTGIILFGSLYKVVSLSGGGARVAEMMDAELIVEDSGDANKQKILNVVEEMAIASGTPVPPVYLLEEDGINAFAAGYRASDAVIGITRGAIEKLSRDQLQGVVAHEFSHIFNGDMRLNIRLIGILHGITIIGTIGYYMLRSGSRSSSRRSKNNGGGIVFLGLGLMAIGYAGTFFGNLIKSAVSRQREFLADASAVQFTRNADGIAGALKRIGGDTTGSLLENSHTAEISHALFSQGISTYLEGLFATHPPLDERIQRIEPYWDGEYEYAPVEFKHAEPEEDTSTQQQAVKTAAILATVATAMETENVTEHVGQPSIEHLDYSHNLIAGIPAILKNAAHEPCGARALVYFMVLDKDQEIRKQQLHHLMAHADPGAYQETIKLNLKIDAIENEHRLPLIDMALSSLRQLSKKQYHLFKQNLDILIEMDTKISLSEWIIQKLVSHHLDRVFEPKRGQKEKRALKKSQNACATLLSLLCYAGKQHGIEKQHAFELARKQLDSFDIQLLEKSKLNLNMLNQALDELALIKPLEKPRLLKACAACITADKMVTIAESELFRAIADTLDCPMPPLVV
ncbi:MAG: M48 family metallopeptidase [Gammaproteobacteria bacterium]|nr:M48 family metallopeptidase [Gammaproteobacteria bacterium]